jgi:hypothetical protein
MMNDDDEDDRIEVNVKRDMENMDVYQCNRTEAA